MHNPFARQLTKTRNLYHYDNILGSCADVSFRTMQIYNLCIEESYDPTHFHGRVESFPFDDNHVPHLEMIKLFCENVSSWLSSHPKNIAVVHCMVIVPS